MSHRPPPSSAPGASGSPLRTVTATATGRAPGVPDVLVATVGVHAIGSGASTVLAEANGRAEALLGALADRGVAAVDVRTTQVDLGPTYTDTGRIDGYRADNVVQVILRDLATAGATLDALVGTVGDGAQIQSVVLGFDDPEELLAAARVDAVDRARAQAQQMAEAAGAALGAVQSITDVVVDSAGPQLFAARMASADGGVPIAAGTQEVSFPVRVVFELTEPGHSPA